MAEERVHLGIAMSIEEHLPGYLEHLKKEEALFADVVLEQLEVTAEEVRGCFRGFVHILACSLWVEKGNIPSPDEVLCELQSFIQNDRTELMAIAGSLLNVEGKTQWEILDELDENASDVLANAERSEDLRERRVARSMLQVVRERKKGE